MTMTTDNTASAHNLLLCLDCATVTTGPATRCPHCHGHLHRRKPASYSRTWAYLTTAIILFFPANLLPITSTTSPAATENVDTLPATSQTLPSETTTASADKTAAIEAAKARAAARKAARLTNKPNKDKPT